MRTALHRLNEFVKFERNCVHEKNKDMSLYPALSKDIQWGVVRARFAFGDEIEESKVSNVTILPFAGDRRIIFQVADGSWELPGGTLEPGESYMEGLRREVREELGAELESFRVFGQFRCESSKEDTLSAAYSPSSFCQIGWIRGCAHRWGAAESRGWGASHRGRGR